MNSKRITIIGSTGSIGTQTLDIVRKRPNEFKVIALAAGSKLNLFVDQIKEFKPEYIFINDENSRTELKEIFPKINILKSIEEIAQIENIDIVVNAVVGIAGLTSTLEALKHAKRVATANKETLVAAPHLVKKYQQKYQSELIPIDSEHVAIHQCISQYLNRNPQDLQNIISKILLTSSGGPFRNLPLSDFRKITKEQALKHPTWKMGPKITIDSATLMNKGLELLEAKTLFDIEISKIQVVIHPQSIVHSAVSFIDANTIAQLSLPDMRVPIQYALDYPQKKSLNLEKEFDIFEFAKLEFEKPNLEKFPALRIAYEVGSKENSYQTVMNSANEAAVNLFLEDKISFVEIVTSIEKTLEKHQAINDPDLDTILKLDKDIKDSFRFLTQANLL